MAYKWYHCVFIHQDLELKFNTCTNQINAKYSTNDHFELKSIWWRHQRTNEWENKNEGHDKKRLMKTPCEKRLQVSMTSAYSTGQQRTIYIYQEKWLEINVIFEFHKRSAYKVHHIDGKGHRKRCKCTTECKYK